MDVAEILDKMVVRLQDKGWIKGAIWEEEFLPDGIILSGPSMPRSIKGRACLRGTAELCSAGPLDLHSAVADRLAAACTALFPERAVKSHWDAVMAFNDHRDTTFEDVLLVVKHAREMA